MLDEMFQRSTISKGPISISGGNKLLNKQTKKPMSAFIFQKCNKL